MRPRRSVSALASSLVTVLALAWSACAAVPDIRFVDEDASDAASSDASADGGDAADAGIGTPTCTGTQPTGATCCGTRWCVGVCDPASCAACEQKGCDTGELCCGKKGQVLCKANCP